ncbi:MAG: hypothetical protein MZU95_13125 [Desulfomicrobium escambiense]|nr:hypothetical protein [Desulfomicrobium escambiense]
MIKDLQIDPATDELLHVDLIRISMDKAIRVAVPVVHRGEPVGVKTEGGFVDFVTREVEVECLPRGHPGEPGRSTSPSSTSTSPSRSRAWPSRTASGSSPTRDRPRPGLHAAQGRGAFPGEKPEGEVAAEEPKEPEVIKKERAEKEEPEK